MALFCKVKNIAYFLCAILLLVTSCYRSKENFDIEHSFAGLLADTLLTIPVDKRTSFLSYYSAVYKEQGKTWLVRVNELTNCMQFYREEDMDFQVCYPVSGPHGIGKLMAVHIISQDSVIIVPRYANRLYLGNMRGEVYKRYDLPADKMIGGMYGFIIGRSPYPLIKYGSKLIVRVTHFYDYCNPAIYDKETAVIAEIDLKEGTIKNILSFPLSDYEGKYWSDQTYSVGMSFDESTGMVWVSFPASEYVHRYSIRDGSIKKEVVKTSRIERIDYFNEFECKKYLTEGNYRVVNEGLQMSFYGFCAYVPAKKRLYRFYHLPADENVKIKNEDNDPDTRLCAHRTGLLIADEEMNILADVLLPDYTYNVYDFFVTEEGLWLSRHNFFRKDKREDVMEFDLIRY